MVEFIVVYVPVPREALVGPPPTSQDLFELGEQVWEAALKTLHEETVDGDASET